MSEKQKNKVKEKLKARGFRMESPFSKLSGFLICWKDEQTGERRVSFSVKWSDAFAQYHKWAKTTEVEVWCLENGQLTGLALACEAHAKAKKFEVA